MVLFFVIMYLVIHFYFWYIITIPDKALFFQLKSTDIFLNSPQKCMLLYSLETPLMSMYNIYFFVEK